MQHPLFRALVLLVFCFCASLAAPRAARAETVREPAFGLPHIFAATDVDLARENGREIAKDRLVQLILLSRVGRGTLNQAFGALDPSTINDDLVARQQGYTSSELNLMYDHLPARERSILLAYCAGVNDTLNDIYSDASPLPLEIGLLQTLGLGDDLFGNATNISDQVDPFYRAPGGGDPEHPAGGFQFTPEMAISIAILEVRNFGFNTFEEDRRLTELQALIAKHGATTGAQIWRDLNFLNDPLAPATVPDPTLPGYGGPLAQKATTAPAAGGAAAVLAQRFPRHDWAGALARRKEAAEKRAELAMKLGAWPKMGSYAWAIGASRSATGNPWVGGFPQTGIQTPSIMHFAENRTDEGMQGLGMEFAGAPFVLIGQTDSVGYTTTTAQLRVVDTFFESVLSVNSDEMLYNDEGTSAPLVQRTEIFRGAPDVHHVFWRSHERNGNGGTRPIIDFLGDAEGTVDAATPGDLTDNDVTFPAGNGTVAIVDGIGAGQVRNVGVLSDHVLMVPLPWTTVPDATSVYVYASDVNNIVAVAADSAVWLEESTAALGFGLQQRAQNVLDERAAIRLIPSTHNFLCADNQTFNGVGTNLGKGNIAYYESGFARLRGSEEKLLPLDGGAPNPLVVASGTVSHAGPTSLTAPGAFAGQDFRAADFNFRYKYPSLQGREYIVSIMGGTGYKQTRRIAFNDADTLQLEGAWGVIPAPGDTFEVQPIVVVGEAINPKEGFVTNWNNKSATADDGDDFGRDHRITAIHERLAADASWDRAKQRQLNKDVAGLDSRGRLGRFLVPRLRQAVDALGDGGVPEVDSVLAALEAHEQEPFVGRRFVDPVHDTTVTGEVSFLSDLINDLENDIYGDELGGAVGIPGGTRAQSMVIHAIDSAAGDVPGSYAQQFSGDYFNGADWRTVLRDALAARAPAGIPAPAPRGVSHYNHPLSGLFPELSFPTTPEGNRGIWEEIIEVGPTVTGEFIFPLGQSGLIQGSLGEGVTSIDPNVLSLHPIWRDWRFVPMLHVGQDLATGKGPDVDNDGVWDAYERWYFGDAKDKAKADADHDGASLLAEFEAGSDPTLRDTDDDGVADGADGVNQDRLRAHFTGLRGRFALPGGGRDRLTLEAKFGGGATIDPVTQELALTISDADGALFEAVLPAGTLTAKGQTFELKDPSGAIGGIEKLTLKPGSAKRPGGLKLRTIQQDLSAIALGARDVTVVLSAGERSIDDTRGWGPQKSDLVSGK